MNNDSTSKVDQLRLLLSTQGAPEGRIRTLDSYQEYIQSPEVLEFLCQYQPTDSSFEVRTRILQILVDSKSTFLVTHTPYRQVLVTALSAEAEPRLRQVACVGIAQGLASDPSLTSICAETLIQDLNPKIQSLCLSALQSLPQYPTEVLVQLSDFLKIAPERLQVPLFDLLTKSKDPQWIENAATAVLRPGVDDETRRRAVVELKALPQLSLETQIALAQHLGREPQTLLVTEIIEKLFSLSELKPELAATALQMVLSRGKEAQPALMLFAFKLNAHPQLLSALILALHSHPDAVVKIQILEMLKNSGLLPLWEMALKDKNPIVREWAILFSSNIIQRHPEEFLKLLLSVYETETLPALRRSSLMLLREHQHLLTTIDPSLINQLFHEQDPLLLKEIAQISLSIPLDRSRNDQRPMILSWLKLLEDASLSAELRHQVITKLEQLDYSADPAMEAALKSMLSQVRSFEELQDLFPRLHKLIKDPGYLLPQLLVLLEKFIGHYPVGPLNEIVRMIRDMKAQVPEIQSRIPYIARITGETWLLSNVGESEQKNELFPNILRHFNTGEFQEAVGLIREGFQNSTLRKSEVVKLYHQALAHPEMYEVSQELLPMMTTANVINPEVIETSFKFLRRFPRKSDSAYRVTEYLLKVGIQVPAFEAQYLNFLDANLFRRYCQQHSDPRNDSEAEKGPLDWNDSRMWKLAYPDWQPFEALTPDQKLLWLRQHVTDDLDPQYPVQWSTMLFALRKYQSVSKLEAQDIVAIGKAFRKTQTDPAHAFLNDRAACLFGEKWNRMDMTDEVRGKLPPEALEIAAEIFVSQVNNWLSVGGLEYAGRVRPLDGMSLDQVQKVWTAGPERWQNLWQGYSELLGINGMEIVPPEPNTKQRPTPHFHMLERNGGVTQLLEFLFKTPAPSVTNAEFHALWKKLIWTASKRVTDSYTRTLQRMDSQTRDRVAKLMS